MTREEALEFIMSGSGTMYDPCVVGTFITHLPEFEAEILAHRNVPVPTFGITPIEELSEAARMVAPAAGLAETKSSEKSVEANLSLKELRALYELSQSVNAARDHAQLAEVFTEKLRVLVPYDSCTLTLVAEEADHVVAHAAGQHANLLAGRKVATGEGVTGWVLANRQPFCNTDPKLDLSPELVEHFASYRTLASFPLICETEMHGALTLYSSTLQEYNEDQRKLLDEATKLLASALSRNGGQAIGPAERKLIQDSDQQKEADFTASSLNPAHTVIESKF